MNSALKKEYKFSALTSYLLLLRDALLDSEVHYDRVA